MFDSLLVLILLLNLFVLGTSRLRAVISASALQGVVLGVLTMTAHGTIKGVGIPRLLHKAMRDVVIEREVEPLIGFIPSLLFGAVGTAIAVIFSSTLPLIAAHKGSLVLPSSFATVL